MGTGRGDGLDFGHTAGAEKQAEDEAPVPGSYEEIEKAASSGTMSEMPNRESTTTSPDKFYKYSLDPDNPRAKGKAEAYRRGLGYTKANAESLIKQVHEAVSSGAAKPYEVQKDDYGVKFKFRVPVTGPNGKTKNVIAVYQIDKGTTSPRMVTNYLEGR